MFFVLFCRFCFFLIGSRCFLCSFFSLRGFFGNRSLSFRLFSSGCCFHCGSFFSRCVGGFLFSLLLSQHFRSCFVHLFLCIQTGFFFGTLFLFILQFEGVGGLLFVALPRFETFLCFCLIECPFGDTAQEVFLHQHPFVGKDVAHSV